MVVVRPQTQTEMKNHLISFLLKVYLCMSIHIQFLKHFLAYAIRSKNIQLEFNANTQHTHTYSKASMLHCTWSMYKYNEKEKICDVKFQRVNKIIRNIFLWNIVVVMCSHEPDAKTTIRIRKISFVPLLLALLFIFLFVIKWIDFH